MISGHLNWLLSQLTRAFELSSKAEIMNEKSNKYLAKPYSVSPSLLDRLMDDRADIYHFSLNQLIESVRRDLEYLLNTPKPRSKFGPEFQELNSSVLAFGIPDVVSISGKDNKVWEKLLEDVEKSIAQFEPRLKNVVTTLKHRQQKHNSKVEFEIRGQLVFDPSPGLVFQSTIDLADGRTLIEFPSVLDITGSD